MMPLIPPGSRGYEKCDDCGQAVARGKMAGHHCTEEQRREHRGREDAAKLAQLETVRAKTAELAMKKFDSWYSDLLDSNEAKFLRYLSERAVSAQDALAGSDEGEVSRKRKSPAG